MRNTIFARLIGTGAVFLGLATWAQGQTPVPEDCPDQGSKLVDARAQAHLMMRCSDHVLQINGLQIRSGGGRAAGCPALITYYPAYFDGPVHKPGMEIFQRVDIPIRVFQYDCRPQFFLFLDLGESCDPIASFEQGYEVSLIDRFCVPLPGGDWFDGASSR